jgi:hypothetical protein
MDGSPAIPGWGNPWIAPSLGRGLSTKFVVRAIVPTLAQLRHLGKFGTDGQRRAIHARNPLCDELG